MMTGVCCYASILTTLLIVSCPCNATFMFFYSYFLDASIGYVTSLFSFFNPVATFAAIFPAAQDRTNKLTNAEKEEHSIKHSCGTDKGVCKDGVCSIDMQYNNNNNAIEGSEGSEMNV